MYYSTKNYGNEQGFSCIFRQWKSDHSRCSLLHGYSIGVKLIFESPTLDEKNWVFDFGGLKAFKSWLTYTFDHTMLIAKDDPRLEHLMLMAENGLADVRIVEGVGCEKFAELAFNTMNDILTRFKKGSVWTLHDIHGEPIQSYSPRYPINNDVRLKSVEVYEHSANSAIFER